MPTARSDEQPALPSRVRFADGQARHLCTERFLFCSPPSPCCERSQSRARLWDAPRGCLGYESPLPSTISDGTGSLPQCLTPVCANLGAFPHPGGYLHTSAMLLHYCNTTSYLLRGPKNLPPRCPAPPRAYSFSDGCCSDKGVACDCLSTVTARCWGGQDSRLPHLLQIWTINTCGELMAVLFLKVWGMQGT